MKSVYASTVMAGDIDWVEQLNQMAGLLMSIKYTAFNVMEKASGLGGISHLGSKIKRRYGVGYLEMKCPKCGVTRKVEGNWVKCNKCKKLWPIDELTEK